MVESAITLVQYVGNDSTVTPYPTQFFFKEASWVRVSVLAPNGEETKLEEGDDYTITGADTEGGGEIVTTVAYGADHFITIFRIVPLTQLLELGYNQRPPSALLEQAFDKLTYIVQQLAGNTADPGRVIKFPVSEPANNNTDLPTPANRRDSVIFFDPTTGEMQVLRMDQIAQRLLVILGAEAVLPYRTREISASYAPTQEDVNSSIRVNTASDVVITLNATEDFSEEFFCAFSRFGIGAVSFAAGPGVTIDSAAGGAPRIFGTKTPVGLQIIGINRWWIYGDLY